VTSLAAALSAQNSRQIHLG